MARTSDISHSELLPLRKALGVRRGAARARLWEGGEAVPGLPMLWPCPIEDELDAPHRRDAVVRPADVYVVRHAQIGGHGAHPAKDGAQIHAAAAIPHYVQQYVQGDMAAERWSFDPGRLKRQKVRRAFALLHFNLMYGHWLTEVFPKLFAIKALGEHGVRAPILLPSSVPFFVQPIIEDVLPGQEVIVYDPEREYVEVSRLILPPMLQEHYVFHPALGRALDAYAGAARATPGGAERIYVSRMGMRTDYAYREMVNEEEIEGVAAESGFHVIRPEMLPWREQLGVFAGARVIAGEFGSGLHNTIFSPRGAAVVSFNWISDVQSLITNFRGQRVGYVLPDDGRARRFSLERSLQQFRIDPEEARLKLALAAEAADKAAA